MVADPWLPYGSAPESAGRRPLYCLPPAGAGATMYRRWQSRLAAVADVRPIQPPGRESRFGEPPITDLLTLAEQVAGVVDAPKYALFGHSLGALVAFEATRLLRQANLDLPDLLVVSGCAAPTEVPLPPDVEYDAAGCEAFLRRLDGTPPEVLDNAELMALIIPALRADLTLLGNYKYQDEPPLDIPIVALGGTHDEVVTYEKLTAWSRQTTARFDVETLDGGHFYLDQNPAFFDTLVRHLT